MAARGVSLGAVERLVRAQMGASAGWVHRSGLTWSYTDPASGAEALVEFDVKKLRKEANRTGNPKGAVPHLVRQRQLEAQSGFWLVRAGALTITALGGFRPGLPADVVRFRDSRIPESLELTVFAPDAAKGLRPVGQPEFDSWDVSPDELIAARRDEMLGNFQNFRVDFLDHGVRRWKDPTKVGFAAALLPWIQTIAEHAFGEWPEGILVAVPDHFTLLVCPLDERSPEAQALICELSPDPVLPLHSFDGHTWQSLDPVPAPEGSS